ncbi:MAG: nucleotide exchange factor GrpE [Proteobacteria bacterium]|nr:MAG: nucleotide exchange factor GrpE [Pseudomonadota bacterium]
MSEIPENENMGTEVPQNEEPAPMEVRIQAMEDLLKEEKNKYLYLYADFENYKKRMIKERSDLIKFGWENVARDLLGVVDNLDRALQHVPSGTDAKFKEGLEMIFGQFRASLEKQGVQSIQTKDAPFNPELHEAMGQEPNSAPQGTITQVLTQGYTLHGRLLRPARVVVSTGQAPVN